MLTKFEEILACDGILVYKTRGVSMEPMLRQNRDLVIIRTPVCRLKKYDVALYKRGNNYILHRVIGVRPDHYLIRGDNTYRVELVPDCDVIGVLKGFQRNGRQYSVTDRSYRIYVRFWQTIYPLRFIGAMLRQAVIRCARKLGILPMIKKIMCKGGVR